MRDSPSSFLLLPQVRAEAQYGADGHRDRIQAKATRAEAQPGGADERNAEARVTKDAHSRLSSHSWCLLSARRVFGRHRDAR